MESNKKNSNFVWIPLLVTLILVIGFALGIVAQRYLMNSKPLIEYLNREDPIDEIVNVIHSDYVENVSKDNLFREAVNGILSSLDPFTVYMSAQQIATSEELLSGSGKGIGIEYVFIADTMVISYVSPESPANKSGLKIGDRIVEVNKTGIAGPDVGQEKAIEAFKNARSDTLALTVMHFNDRQPLKVVLVKDNYKKNSINASFMIDETVGYIKFSLFSNSIYNDVVDAIERLQKEGMTSLILDIRNNGGGYFDEAVLLTDEFIDGDKLIVYTSGKRDGIVEYKAGVKGVFESGPLIIFVNNNSASSSEVLAGSIQDWDRGIIIGENTYGKGLVQEQFDLSDGSAIRLTIARYFTPSGRSIQKPYMAHSEKEDSTGSEQEIFEKTQQFKIFYSLVNNRPLKGMGGIMPDVLIEDEINQISPELKELIYNNVIEKFINKYYFTTFKQQFSFNDFNEFMNDFEVDQETLDELYQSLMLEDAVGAKRIWQSRTDFNYLRKSMKAMIARLEFDQNAYYKVLLANDEYITRSLDILHSDLYNKILKKP